MCCLIQSDLADSYGCETKFAFSAFTTTKQNAFGPFPTQRQQQPLGTPSRLAIRQSYHRSHRYRCSLLFLVRNKVRAICSFWPHLFKSKSKGSEQEANRGLILVLLNSYQSSAFSVLLLQVMATKLRTDPVLRERGDH